MPDPAPEAPRYWKNTHFVSAGGQGFTESITFKIVGAGSPVGALSKAARAYHALRKKVMSSKVAFDGYRASDEAIRGDADFNPAPTFEAGVGLKTGAAAPLEMGWLFRLQGLAGATRANRILRGFPDSLVYSKIEKGKFLDPVPTDVQRLRDDLNTFMTISYVDGAITATPVIPTSADGLSLAAPAIDVEEMAVDADGYLILKIVGDLLAATKGSKIRIHLDRSRQSKGLSGRYVVMKTPTLAAGVKTFSLNKHGPAAPGAVMRVTGKAQIIVPAWATISNVTLIRGAKKDVGRAFFLTRGRAPAKSC